MSAQSGQNSAESTAHLFNSNHERAVENIYVSQAEEQVFCPFPHATNNDFIELVLQEARNEIAVNDRDESMPTTPTYENAVNDRDKSMPTTPIYDTRVNDGDGIMSSTSIYVNYINVPPRLYSFDSLTVSQEQNNELPQTF